MAALPKMSITVHDFTFRTFWMKTRFPFQYGIASMTSLPHVFVETEMSVNGKRVQGLASEGLPPKWFSKNPETRFEEDDLPAMRQAIEQAAQFAKGLQSESPFAWWRDLYAQQQSWAEENSIPLLLAHLGTSLVERACLDGFCRATATPLWKHVRDNTLEIELGAIHPELAGCAPSQFLPKRPLKSIAVRHTVGLGDPLETSDVESSPEDGLPLTLVESIEQYGLRYFKIKLRGIPNVDIPRLKRLWAILSKRVPDFQFTLDGNEQFRHTEAFREQWELYQREPDLRQMLAPPHLLFVEQPLLRDFALEDSVRDAMCDWEDAPPTIIDESDAEITSLRRALDLGYSGTSHKNCKGVFKGIANACFLEYLRKIQPDHPWILSGEDLANVGPVALLLDISVMALLGIGNVERNGHHYFAGLSMYDKTLQQRVLSVHRDLYRPAGDFCALHIKDGRISLDSVNYSSFGFSGDPDWFKAIPGDQLVRI